MDKQLHQLVVASVVALLTSGTITLVGLSAAQMEGGMPPPGGEGGNMQSGGDHMGPPMGGDAGMQSGGNWGSSGGNWDDHSGQPSEGNRGDANMGDRTGSSGNQPRNDAGFQRDGDNFQMHGRDYQKDGAGFQRDGAGFQKSNESHMGRFGGEMKDGENRGRFQMNDSSGRFGSPEMRDASGAGRMEEMGNKAGGKKKMRDMSDFDNDGGVLGGNRFGDDNAGPGHEQMMKKFMHGAGDEGGKRGIGVGGGNFDMSQFEQFVPKKSTQDVDALLNTIDTDDSDGSVELTAAQTQKVENALNAAEKVEAKAVPGIEAVLDKKPSKASAGKAMKYVLELVKQWVNVAKIADGISDAGGDIVDDADGTVTRLQETLAEGCEALNAHFGSSKNWKKGAVVCDKVMDQIGEDTEE